MVRIYIYVCMISCILKFRILKHVDAFAFLTSIRFMRKYESRTHNIIPWEEAGECLAITGTQPVVYAYIHINACMYVCIYIYFG